MSLSKSLHSDKRRRTTRPIAATVPHPSPSRRPARAGAIVFELVRIAALAAVLDESDDGQRDELAVQLEALAARVRS